MLRPGDKIDVAIVDIDKKTGKLRLSLKPLLVKPEGYVEPPAREERGERGGYGDRDRGDRGGRGGGGFDRGGDRGGRGGDDRRGGGDRGPRGGGGRW